MTLLKFTPILLVTVVVAAAQTSVLTNRIDNSRTGWNSTETALTNTNVSPSAFGKLFRYSVDGSVFGQPLYVPHLAIPGKGAHNVLFVVTMNDSVYAFDADQNITLWQTSFANPAAGVTPVPIADITGSNSLNIVGFVGIESTPVIDPGSKTIYIVARTKEVTSSAANYVQRLHALDITTGAEKFNGPATIGGSVAGTGEGSAGGLVTFDPFWENQRAGLALANGQVIITWASHEDDQPYHGWVMAYSATTLAQTGILNVTPNGIEGGIWMSGRAPIVDARGNIYLLTGNGSTDFQSDFGESALRLSTAGGKLTKVDYFTASNALSLNNSDEDLGSGGLVMLPGYNLLVGGGKQGVLYLLNSSNLGHYAQNDTQIPQKFQAVDNMIFAGPAYWQSASKGPLLYLWTMSDSLKGFHFNGATFDTAPLVESSVQSPSGVNPGATLSISSSGSSDNTGIVWASMPIDSDGDHGLVLGMLRALNATTGAEIWNSQMNGGDALGDYHAKFVPPTVVNGKVYMGTFTDYSSPNHVVVYGLLTPSPKFTMAVSPLSASTIPGSTVNYTVSVSPLSGHSFSGTVNLKVAGLPLGATASFNPPSLAGAGSSVLRVSTTTATPLGTSTLTITGTGAGTGFSTTLSPTLTVTDKMGALSVNFVGNGTTLAPGDIAGVVAKPQWNNLPGAISSVPQALVDEFGLSSGAMVSWSGENPWALPISATTPNAIMMQGYLDDGNAGTSTVTFTGIPLYSPGYTVYVYLDGDNGSSTRLGVYTLTGAGIPKQSINVTDLANVNFSGTFTQALATHPAGNYVVFTIPGGDFTVTAAPKGSGTRAPINGIQIIPN